MKRYKLIKIYPGCSYPVGSEAVLVGNRYRISLDGSVLGKVRDISQIESFPEFWEYKVKLLKTAGTVSTNKALNSTQKQFTTNFGLLTMILVEIKNRKRLSEIKTELEKFLLNGEPFPLKLLSEREEIIKYLSVRLGDRKTVGFCTINSAYSEYKKKPPLGIIPKGIHDEFRLDEIHKAINRYLSEKMAVPAEWLIEKMDLESKLKKS